MLPIFALPSPYGIGTMGQEARKFVDFLHSAGQRYWQILPVCPTSFGDSPYQSFSTSAGNPYFIDLDQLKLEGLLREEDLEDIQWDNGDNRVDYGRLYAQRYPVLRRAFDRFVLNPPEDFMGFCAYHDWLEDYALFMALKDVNGGKPWQEWPEELRRREPQAIAEAKQTYSADMAFWKFLQYLFYRQWGELKRYANDRGISIIGDVPIYVSGDSVDVWANPDQFQLDENLLPTEVAGCPPDAFSADGQLWGNPLFNWDKMEQEGYAWWVRRIAHQATIYDVLRIDHFRGFEAYFAIPYGAPNAREGQWRPGPGMKLFHKINEAVGQMPIIAEDLGFLTDGVRQLLADSGYPGMKVLEFAFDSREDSDYLPHNYPKNCVVYTGTHDNSTVMGWFHSASADDVALAVDYLKLTEEEGYNWGMMRGAWASVGNLAVVQMQDVLGLGDEARMNTPSTVGANWQWRMERNAYDDALAAKLRHQMELYHRI